MKPKTPVPPVHPEHPGMVPGTEHLDLGDGCWADLRKLLDHGQASLIETAQLMAEYEPPGRAFEVALALVQSALSAAPQEWQDKHGDSTLQTVRWAVESYEEEHSGAMLSPLHRQQIADAQIELRDVYGKVYSAAWSVRDSDGNTVTDLDMWPSVDSAMTRVISARSLALWRTFNRGIQARLKDAAATSPDTDD